MKAKILNLLKIVLPLGLGLYLVYFFYSTLTPQDKIEIGNAFKEANYWWIAFSLVFAMLSHLSRAWRWKYTLEPLNIKPDFWNSFFTVMIAYLVNLAVPRLGEVSRVGLMARYEKQPFNKLLGTVIAERVADLIILLGIAATVVIIQYQTIKSLLEETAMAINAKLPGNVVLLIAAFLGSAGVAALWWFLKSSTQLPLAMKIKSAIKGILEGLQSILTMKQKWAFLGHTLFIWVMYVLMFYICFFSLESTSHVPFGGIVTAFVLGGFTIVATNGGIGAYPLAIQGVLLLYGIDKNVGGAFGWIVWTAQTLLLLVAGALAFALLPWYNKRKAQHEHTSTLSS